VDELLTDQQQAEIVRTWLRENGGFLLLGLLLGLGGLFGWNQWQDGRQENAGEASLLYAQLADAVQFSRPVRAAELEAQLVAEHDGSPYVDQARLAMAKLHMDRNEAEQAAGYLVRLVDDTSDAAMENIGRLRLARVRIQQQQYDDALQVLAAIDENSAFAGRFHDVRGDAHYAAGDREAARLEYETALTTVEAGALDRGLVQAKLDSLGVGSAASPAAEAVVPAEDAPAE
jgi:predicted negative regulator of RcsB-dependent stress response